jgi:type IX secretion system PorP/SprF family membrane protein
MKSYITLLLVFAGFFSSAQDAVFSQFMFNKLYINPAFAGSAGGTEYQLNSRQQWINAPGPLAYTGAYTFNQAAVQTFCPGSGVGMALQLRNSIEGEGILSTHNANFYIGVTKAMYKESKSHNNRLPSIFGYSVKAFQTSFGMSMGIGQKTLDWDRLKFSSQYHPYQGYFRDVSNVNPQNNRSNTIVDPSFGIRSKVAFGEKMTKNLHVLSGGYSLYHLTKPVETFFDIENQMPRRHTAFLFYHFTRGAFKFSNNSHFTSLGIIYDYQLPQSTSTFYVGRQIIPQFYASAGIRHRNFLDIRERSDAGILTINGKFDRTLIGLSYDFTLSTLSMHRTQGTFELSLVYYLGTTVCPEMPWNWKLDKYRRGQRRKKSGQDCVDYLIRSLHRDDFVIFMP